MATLEEAVVASLFQQSDDIADQVMKHHPVLAALKEKGKIKKFSGGYEIRKPIMYNATAQGGFYSHFDAFDLDGVEDATALQFEIRQAYEPVGISGRDRRANRDAEALLDHVDMKVEAAIARLRNTISDAVRGDGTTPLSFDGIGKMVSSSPSSGTYGGYDRSTNTWARNATYSVSGGFSVANIQQELTAALMSVTRGEDMPDTGILGSTAWKYLHNSLTAIQRIREKGSAGFKGRGLEYDGCMMYHDGGYGGGVVGATTARLLNTNYITLDLVRGADFKPVAPEMDRPTDQDAFFTVILVEGNLCCSAPALNVYAA